MIHFKDNKNKSALSTRWAQMSKQEQIIERKKIEIQAKLDAQKQAAALAAQAKLTNPTTNEEKGSVNIFSNDGSFMNQFKALLEKQKHEAKDKDEQDNTIEEKVQQEINEPSANDNEYQREYVAPKGDNRRKSGDRGQREKNRRWNDRGRNRAHSPITPVIVERNNVGPNKGSSHNIPSLMQIPIMPPNHNQSDSEPWMQSPKSDDDQDSNEPNNMGTGSLKPPPMPPGLLASSLMGPSPNIGLGPNMGLTSGVGSGPMVPGPNMGLGPAPNMGSGPNMPPGPHMRPAPHMGSGPNLGHGPNMGPGPIMGPGPNMGSGSMLGPRGPMPPMPPGGPFMGGPAGPPNFPMPPNFMGPNGPCGPMPTNMRGPNMQGPGGPNGPMPPFFGPPFPNPMMGPNGPNSMNNGNMPFMGPRPPFPPNGPPNFGNGNMPPMPFMPPNPPLPPNTISDSKPFDNTSMPNELMNIQPPLPPMSANQMSKMDMENKPTSLQSSQVLTDAMPPAVQRAATEVACNGDHWENVLKAIHTQDQSLWFLHNPNSKEYKMYKELLAKYRKDQDDKKPEVKPEDKYEPEFSLEDDESNDDNACYKEERDSYSYNRSQYPVKREQASSQSDEEYDGKKDKRKKKKSRWSNEPPVADIKPPGIVAPMPSAIGSGLGPGQLAKIDEEGLRLGAVNRNNPALMQYAMTNYGTTNLSAEDWKKCEDNFKLNLLYQDMLKKRQEVERLAAAGKFKYEYDSDEDTSEGTWEHKLRAKEMNATEKWATELTKQAAGKHHIGDFLPPEELKKFMEKYSAVKSGKEPDLSDYKEFKLKEDNVGFKMLQKLGWSEGQGLGAEGSGIVEPINKANQPVANLGLGANTSDVVSPEDDEFDAYRKRMMLAYRFRPNPLNNPRRPYY